MAFQFPSNTHSFRAKVSTTDYHGVSYIPFGPAVMCSFRLPHRPYKLRENYQKLQKCSRSWSNV